MRPLKESTPHELYLRVSSVAKPMAPLRLYANVTGKFTVERELGEKVKDKLRDRILEQKRAERRTVMVPGLPQHEFYVPPVPLQFSDPPRSAPARVASPLPPAPPKEVCVPVHKRIIRCLALNPHLTADAVIKKVAGPNCGQNEKKELMVVINEVKFSSFILFRLF